MPSGGFVGRRNEVERADQQLRTTSARAAVLAGPAGVGKTRLAREIADGWRAGTTGGGGVEWISGTASTAGIPFGAVARLLPPSLPTPNPADPLQEPGTVLREVLAAIRAQGERLVVIDDVHLLDDASATLVQHLALDAAVPTLLIVRTGEPVPPAIEVLWRDGHVERVEVRPLTQVESTELAASLLNGEVDASSAASLHRTSGGNPLLLRELIEDARAAGALSPDDGGWWRWDGRVGRAAHLHEAVGARLDALGPSGRRMLTLLALGEPLPAELVGSLCPGVDLDQAERRELVRVDVHPARPGGFDRVELRLGHPLFGEILRARSQPAALRGLRLELAEAIDAVEAKEEFDVLRVAALRLEAGDAGAYPLYEHAGKRAIAYGDSATARQFAEAAVTHGGSVEALVLLGEAHLTLLELDQAIDALDRAAELAEGDALLVRIAFSLHQAHLHRGDPLPASQLMERFAERVRDPAWLAILEGQLAQDLMLRGETKAGGQQAERLLRDWHHDKRVRLRLVTAVVPARAIAGRTAAALELTQVAFPDAMELQDEIAMGPSWVVGVHLQALLLAGRLSDAEQFVDLLQALPQAPKIGGGTFIDLYVGRLALITGDVRRAAATLRVASEAYERTDLGGLLRWARSMEAEAHALCGDLEQAAFCVHRAEVAESRTLTYDGDARRARAWVTACSGRVPAAIVELVDLAGEQLREGQNLLAAISLHDAVRLGASPSSVPGLAAILPVVDGGWGHGIRLHVAALDGGGDPAGLSAAAQWFEAMGAKLHAAEAWSQAGDDERAATLLAACGHPATPSIPRPS